MHEWIPTSEGQSLAQLVTAQEALGNTVLQQDADNSRVLVDTPSGGSGLANALVYKGATDCSTNPNYPAADAGHLYIVSVAGKIGGASGISVEAGDSFICKTDGTAAGTQAQRGASWNVVQGNTVGALLAANNLSDVASAATARTNLVLGSVDNTSDASKPVSTAQQTALDLKVPTSYLDTDTALTANSDLKVATQKATKAYVDANGGGVTNGAGANVVPKSDGTNLVASRVTDDGEYIKAISREVVIGDEENNGTQIYLDDELRTAQLIGRAGYVGDGLFVSLVEWDGVTGITKVGDAFNNGNGTLATVNDTAQTISLTAANGININSVAKLAPLAFAALPASPAEGMMAWVNDSNTAVWGATVAAGGTDKVLVVYNGTNWTVAGK